MTLCRDQGGKSQIFRVIYLHMSNAITYFKFNMHLCSVFIQKLISPGRDAVKPEARMINLKYYTNNIYCTEDFVRTSAQRSIC